MRTVTLLMLSLFPLAACAGSGSWTQKSAGGVVSVGNQILTGSPLRSPSPLPSSARIQRVAWRIELLSPPPPGLQIKLCSAAACLPLESLAGQRSIDLPFSAGGPFRFIYSVDSRGPLIPALNVVSNQVTVNYQLDSVGK